MLLLITAAVPAWGTSYSWPLKQFGGISSSFGEYRAFRYHAGCDLRTGGVEGLPVVAVADGYVMRASTSYHGYGRGLYLKLDDGRIAVYGHLKSFGPQVTARVRAEQRKLKRYKTDQYFKPDEIRVRKGMVIARSGQTGAGAPHLHFEIRTTDNRPLNPLTHGFRVADSRDPEISELWIMPQYRNGVCGTSRGGVEPGLIPLRGTSRTPLRPVGDTVFASGPIGFAVKAVDRRPHTGFRFNPYEFVLIVADDTVFQSRYDTLDYATMAQSELERPIWFDPDAGTYCLYKAPGNQMAHSRTSPDYPDGIIDLTRADTVLPFKLVVLDTRGNTRTVLGLLSYREPRLLRPEGWGRIADIRAGFIEYQADDTTVFALRRQIEAGPLKDQPWNILRGQPRIHRLYAVDANLRQPVSLTLPTDSDTLTYHVVCLKPDSETVLLLPDSSLKITAPAGSVYEPQWLWVAEQHLDDTQRVWRLGPPQLELAAPLQLAFPAPVDSTVSLWSIDLESKEMGFVENRRSDGEIQCTTRRPAAYAFSRDTIPPVISRLTPREGSTVSPKAAITATLKDDRSGVGDDTKISIYLDGEWLVPEYDPETYQFIARPWDRMRPGQHTLTLEVSDWAGNSTKVTRTFQVSRR